jgi:hypothetical protein
MLATCTSIILLLLILIDQNFAGVVRPFGATPIILSSTNAGNIADYNFTMILDTELPASGTVEITFPLSQYVPGLGLPNTFTVYGPYPTVITAVLDPTDIYAKTVICTPGNVKAGVPFTIGILQVNNPLKVGGTGNFKVNMNHFSNYRLLRSWVQRSWITIITLVASVFIQPPFRC